MPERARIFADCGRVILKIYETGSEASKQSLEPIATARKCCLAIIREIAEACESDADGGIASLVHDALSDLHTKVPYTYAIEGQTDRKLVPEKLIRDLAEICATFRSIELGVERSSRERVLEARIFCSHMAAELNQLPQG